MAQTKEEIVEELENMIKNMERLIDSELEENLALAFSLMQGNLITTKMLSEKSRNRLKPLAKEYFGKLVNRDPVRGFVIPKSRIKRGTGDFFSIEGNLGYNVLFLSPSLEVIEAMNFFADNCFNFFKLVNSPSKAAAQINIFQKHKYFLTKLPEEKVLNDLLMPLDSPEASDFRDTLGDNNYIFCISNYEKQYKHMCFYWRYWDEEEGTFTGEETHLSKTKINIVYVDLDYIEEEGRLPSKHKKVEDYIKGFSEKVKVRSGYVYRKRKEE